MNDADTSTTVLDDAEAYLAAEETDQVPSLSADDELDGADVEAEADDEAEELFTVKVNGEELKVTKDELINGYSRQADYTRKAQALAEERKAFQAQQTQAVRESDEVAKMRAVLLGLDHKLSQYDNVNWAELNAKNPQQANTEFMNYQTARDIRSKLASELQTKEQAEAAKQQEALLKSVASARETLAQLMPDFETVKPKLMDASRAYGFTDQETHGIIDPRQLVVLRDAMNWRNYQSKLVAQAKAKPETAKPISGKRTAPTNQGFNQDAYLNGIL